MSLTTLVGAEATSCLKLSSSLFSINKHLTGKNSLSSCNNCVFFWYLSSLEQNITVLGGKNRRPTKYRRTLQLQACNGINFHTSSWSRLG